MSTFLPLPLFRASPNKRPALSILMGLALFGAMAVFWPLKPVQAASSPWNQSEYGAVRLISATQGVEPAGETMVGVQLRLETGWKVYWRSPGETGVPTRFDWSGSTNVADAMVYWPTPIRFSDFEFETYGYDREVVFPVAVTPIDPTQPVELKVKMVYGVCKNICIPMDVTMDMTLPIETVDEPTRFARIINQFMAQVPRGNGAEGLTLERVTVEQGRRTHQAEVFARSETPLMWPDVAIELPPGYRTGIPSVNISLDRRSVRLRVPLWTSFDPDSLEGETVTVTLWDEDGRSIEQDMVIERRASVSSSIYDR